MEPLATMSGKEKGKGQNKLTMPREIPEASARHLYLYCTYPRAQTREKSKQTACWTHDMRVQLG